MSGCFYQQYDDFRDVHYIDDVKDLDIMIDVESLMSLMPLIV